ncbi:MAG: flagellar type III secretion system pore protein FliP [Lachnospiraceae bacterium]|nr:flagellar type III secretion system pore protein FliP [Lachnospiraceae bacterium]MBQ4069117.1 flagellar type III secretion system pore protein FliP [Lachnospiraceae bacterium]
MRIMKIIPRFLYSFIIILMLVFSNVVVTEATEVENTTEDSSVTDGTDTTGNNIFGVELSTDDDSTMSGAIQIVIVLTILALCPSILILLTSFTRIIIVLHFTRAALSTQTAPPNQVLIGLALFLTFFIMAPVFNQINTEAIQPLSRGEITQEEAFEAGVKPIRNFMLNQVKDEDLDSMAAIAGYDNISTQEEIPLVVLIPSFILSELRIAFWIGFLIYIPFLVIDMVVSSVLMSMGMMMLPPTTISMPFKILLFVLADGWNLIIVNLMSTFVT